MEDIKLTPFKQTRVYQEAREEEATDAIGRLLKKRFGQDLSEQTRERIQSLSLPALRKLTEDLLDFTYEADLQPWLDASGNFIPNPFILG